VEEEQGGGVERIEGELRHGAGVPGPEPEHQPHRYVEQHRSRSRTRSISRTQFPGDIVFVSSVFIAVPEVLDRCVSSPSSPSRARRME